MEALQIVSLKTKDLAKNLEIHWLSATKTGL
jgi:hypothetical protein